MRSWRAAALSGIPDHIGQKKTVRIMMSPKKTATTLTRNSRRGRGSEARPRNNQIQYASASMVYGWKAIEENANTVRLRYMNHGRYPAANPSRMSAPCHSRYRTSRYTRKNTAAAAAHQISGFPRAITESAHALAPQAAWPSSVTAQYIFVGCSMNSHCSGLDFAACGLVTPR